MQIKVNALRQNRAQDWLNSFLQARSLTEADGRHLFYYHITPTEFNELSAFLIGKVQATARVKTFVLNYWCNNKGFCALLVLYASHWWQQNYSGSQFEWKPIMDSLAFPEGSWEPGQMGTPVTLGLHKWRLEPSEQGHKYLGAIAREAGLPLKLLSEYRGKVGIILKRVLREAIRSGQSGDIIHNWVANMKTQLPMSYRDDIVISLLADSINIIIDIKRQLNVKNAEDVFAELESTCPHWKKRFPLPLDDTAGSELLNQLLIDATSHDLSPTSQRGSPIQAERRLHRIQSGQWSLETSIVIPDCIHLDLADRDGQNWRSLLLEIRCGQESRECILRKHAQHSYYISNTTDVSPFIGPHASSEVQLHYTTASGQRVNAICSGGQELDEDLPWIFEANEPINVFCQQGGGSVSREFMFVALANSWQINPQPEAVVVAEGVLPAAQRSIYRLSGRGEVCKDAVKYLVRTGQLGSDISYGWQGLRYWEYVTSPRMVFRGTPFPVKQTTTSTTEIRNAKLLWKPAQQVGYSAANAQIYGLGRLWYQDRNDGQSLRNSMLILPSNASLHFEAQSSLAGSVFLKNWKAESICLDCNQGGLQCQCTSDGETLQAKIVSDSGQRPPEQVRLCVYWHGCPEPAHICIPFPAQGARLFDRDANEVSWNRTLCVSDLLGMRLQCMTGASNRVHFELVFSVGSYNRTFPIDTSTDSHCLIRMQDWQQEMLTALATVTELDSCVTMRVLADHKEMARWEFARYSHRFSRDDDGMSLELDGLTDYAKKTLHVVALCLTAPQLGPQQLIGHLDDHTIQWPLSGQLPCNGAWLIYDKAPHTVIRPALWYEFYAEGPLFDEQDNALKKAILAPGEEREEQLQKCIADMCDDPSAIEWDTLAILTEHLSHLPLSTLDIWKAFSKNNKAMAIMALRPDIKFCGLTERASLELPFIWLAVSRREWEMAGKHLHRWCVEKGDLESASSFYDMLWKARRDEISTHCPIINSFLHIACPLEQDQNDLNLVKNTFKFHAISPILYGNFKNDLFTRCAELEWPEDFREHIRDSRQNSSVRKFIPSPQVHRDSIVCTPILLALQAFTGEKILFGNEGLSPQEVSAIRQHVNFDFDWFDSAFTYTINCCYAENIECLESI